MNLTSSNETALDDDVFFDRDSSQSYYPSNSSKLEAVWVTTGQLINSLLWLGSVIASIFLIYVILRFERFRSKTNIFILHYAIACLIDHLLMPLFLILAGAFIKTPNLDPRERFCIGYNIHSSTSLLIFIFASATAVYWYLENWQRDWLKRTPRFLLYFTLFLYILYFLKVCIYATECLVDEDNFSKYVLMLCYIMSLIIIISLNILAYKITLTQSQRNTKYQLSVSSFIILSYLPSFIYALIYYELDLIPTLIHNTIYFAEFLANSSVMVVVYLLGEKNKYFKSAYNRIFKRSVRRYNEDDLEETSDVDRSENGGDSNRTASRNGLSSTV